MFATSDHPETPPLTGRCYCSQTTLSASVSPDVVALCHCSDCRRLTGAPVAAYAAFRADQLTISPAPRHAATVTPGVDRWFCNSCGAALAATYDYLPGQVYVPVGLWDQAETLVPQTHSHAQSALPWLHILDDLPRNDGSARKVLTGQSK